MVEKDVAGGRGERYVRPCLPHLVTATRVLVAKAYIDNMACIVISPTHCNAALRQFLWSKLETGLLAPLVPYQNAARGIGSTGSGEEPVMRGIRS